MHRNRYIVIVCCVIIAFFIFRQYNLAKKAAIQARVDEPVSHTGPRNTLPDDSILLPPETNPESPKVIAPPPRDPNAISAETYLVGNLKTGETYISFNPDKVFPIASLSKLFTALVSLHDIDPSTEITITQSMLDAYGDAGRLVKDEKLTVHELLYPLLLESSNDAAEAIAQSFGYAEFISAMNLFASENGMKKTSFKDASGLSPGNVSNAENLFKFAQYLFDHEKDLLEITKEKEKILATTTDHGYHRFVSINPFVFYEPFIGGKTGRTDEAKESMITLLNYEIASKTYPIAIIVLRSDYGERSPDTEKILDRFAKKIENNP